MLGRSKIISQTKNQPDLDKEYQNMRFFNRNFIFGKEKYQKTCANRLIFDKEYHNLILLNQNLTIRLHSCGPAIENHSKYKVSTQHLRFPTF